MSDKLQFRSLFSSWPGFRKKPMLTDKDKIRFRGKTADPDANWLE